jgi:biotin carboxyl carrier protein
VTFEVEVSGRARTVLIEPIGAAGPDGGRFRVRIDGQAVELSARPTDLGLSILFESDGGRSLDAAVTPLQGGEILVQFPHIGLTAVVDGRRRRRQGDEAGGSTGGEQRLVAPMPGKIVRILARPGETVAARQGLVVIEAMKMENELGAIRAGVVREVAVAEGASVAAGRLLVVVDSA